MVKGLHVLELLTNVFLFFLISSKLNAIKAEKTHSILKNFFVSENDIEYFYTNERYIRKSFVIFSFLYQNVYIILKHFISILKMTRGLIIRFS